MHKITFKKYTYKRFHKILTHPTDGYITVSEHDKVYKLLINNKIIPYYFIIFACYKDNTTISYIYYGHTDGDNILNINIQTAKKLLADKYVKNNL